METKERLNIGYLTLICEGHKTCLKHCRYKHPFKPVKGMQKVDNLGSCYHDEHLNRKYNECGMIPYIDIFKRTSTS